jgi:hypothetical protein
MYQGISVSVILDFDSPVQLCEQRSGSEGSHDLAGRGALITVADQRFRRGNDPPTRRLRGPRASERAALAPKSARTESSALLPLDN